MAYFISMEPIFRTDESRTARWMIACLAAAFSFAAALAHLAYVGNGIAAGAIIGLPGREGDVTVAQHHAVVWLGISALFSLVLSSPFFGYCGSERRQIVSSVLFSRCCCDGSFIPDYVHSRC